MVFSHPAKGKEWYDLLSAAAIEDEKHKIYNLKKTEQNLNRILYITDQHFTWLFNKNISDWLIDLFALYIKVIMYS